MCCRQEARRSVDVNYKLNTVQSLNAELLIRRRHRVTVPLRHVDKCASTLHPFFLFPNYWVVFFF